VHSVATVRITHPFHPLRDRDLRFVESRIAWGEARVFFEDPEGRLRRVPLGWTSLSAADPFVGVAASRSPFRLADLRRLVDLIAEVGASPGGGGRPSQEVSGK
jgi:hypothetical protein